MISFYDVDGRMRLKNVWDLLDWGKHIQIGEHYLFLKNLIPSWFSRRKNFSIGYISGLKPIKLEFNQRSYSIIKKCVMLPTDSIPYTNAYREGS